MNMKMYWHVVEPLDVLMFRESKPFSPGDGSWAKGLFPPMPTAVFQALRSALPYRSGEGPHTKQRDLEFLGPFLLSPDDQLWLPRPKDLMCLGTKTVNEQERGEIQEDLLDEVIKGDCETMRLQPANPESNPFWKHLKFGGSLKPMVIPSLDENQFIQGQPQPWIRASALQKYLEGENPNTADNFCADPWTVQVQTHIRIKVGERTVENEEGYFTEVSTRMHSGWRFLCAFSEQLPHTTVRLGGEGHRALIYEAPDSVTDHWNAITAASTWRPEARFAYLLTPGLVLTAPDSAVYTSYDSSWTNLVGCATGRPLLWGGISTIRRRFGEEQENFALLPQRSFVPPGTVYHFSGQPPQITMLMPSQGGKWIDTFEKLNYGKLLWGKSCQSN